MPKETYESLVTHIQEEEHALQQAARQQRILEHELSQQRALAAKRLVQLKTMQTLSLGIFTTLQVEEILQLTCQTVVHQLLWDSAFVLDYKGQRGVILASYQATEKQLNHLKDYLGESSYFKEAYQQHAALFTRNSTTPSALALRSLFQTDEIVALPIQFGEDVYGYLVACSHSHRSEAHSQEDVDFLAILTSHIAHAVQNSLNFASLAEQNVRLRELDQIKDSFISITSHQLRTPLSIIKWILSVLQADGELAKLTEQRHMIDQAYISNERLIHVVNDLLNVSRIQEGQLPYSPQPTDLKVMLRDILSGAEKMAEDKKVRLEANLDQELPPLNLDPILFKEAVQNLVDNAIDYNKPGGTVTIALEQDKKYVRILVTNTGQGIAKDEQLKIFNQFYRSPEGIKQQPNGNGLGLYLSRTIVQQHGGDITCKSEVGKDTTFTVTIPLKTNHGTTSA